MVYEIHINQKVHTLTVRESVVASSILRVQQASIFYPNSKSNDFTGTIYSFEIYKRYKSVNEGFDFVNYK